MRKSNSIRISVENRRKIDKLLSSSYVDEHHKFLLRAGLKDADNKNLQKAGADVMNTIYDQYKHLR